MGEQRPEVEGVASETVTLVRKLFQGLESVRGEGEYFPDRRKQLETLQNLPDNFLEIIKAHLIVVEKEQVFFSSFRGEETEIRDKAKEVRGKLFEMLVEAENSQFKTPLAKELLALAHNPGLYQLEDFLATHRNPDLAFIHLTETGDVVIEAVGEAKLGLLGKRALNQLRKSGFWEGLNLIVDFLNITDPKSLKRCELKQIAECKRGGRKIIISPEFRQYVFVPANRDIGSVENLIQPSDGYEKERFTEEERKRLAEILGNKRVIQIKKSCFSTDEVAVMAQVLLKKIG